MNSEGYAGKFLMKIDQLERTGKAAMICCGGYAIPVEPTPKTW